MLTFTKLRKIQRVYLQIDNQVALTYLLKIGGTHNKKLSDLAKDI